MAESDYAGKDVRGKIVLSDGVLSVVQALAVEKFGAAGIVSDMPNQTTAWSGLDTSIVPLGGIWMARCPRASLSWFRAAPPRTFARQMAAGHTVLLSAHVRAEVVPGHWTVVTGIIRGTDPSAGEIV